MSSKRKILSMNSEHVCFIAVTNRWKILWMSARNGTGLLDIKAVAYLGGQLGHGPLLDKKYQFWP